MRGNLDVAPGGSHETPWRQSGALLASIEISQNGLTAQVGSNDPAAGPQEYGTATIAPRPFFAPAAAALGKDLADEIGASLAAALVAALS